MTIAPPSNPLEAIGADITTTVYLYQFWDESASLFVTAKREATLDCIRCGLGIPLLTSARQVALSRLDDVGRLSVIVQEEISVLKAS